MGSETRNQEYAYQYKSVSIANQNFCGFGPFVQINLPDNILTIKDMFIRLVVQFDPSETYKNISTLTLNGLTNFSFFYANTTYTMNVNWNANASNILDARIALQGQLRNLHIFPATAGNQPYFILSFGNSQAPYTVSNNNRILLWKIDFTYTTQGIR